MTAKTNNEKIIQPINRKSLPRYNKIVPIVYDPQNDPKCISRTQQHFKEEADINNIMRRYAKTGILTDPAHVSNRKPSFADFTMQPAYQEMQNQIAFVVQEFEKLPADQRLQFGNSPENYLAYITEDKERAIKEGLIQKEEQEKEANAEKEKQPEKLPEKPADQPPT